MSDGPLVSSCEGYHCWQKMFRFVKTEKGDGLILSGLESEGDGGGGVGQLIFGHFVYQQHAFMDGIQ